MDKNHAGEPERAGPQNAKEILYEKLRGKLSVKALDIIIIALIVMFIAVVVIGAIRGNGG